MKTVDSKIKVSINAAEPEIYCLFYFVLSPSLSKPVASTAHNATQPPTDQRSGYVILGAANVGPSRDNYRGLITSANALDLFTCICPLFVFRRLY